MITLKRYELSTIQIILRCDMTMQNIENILEKCLKTEHSEFMQFYDNKVCDILPFLHSNFE